MPGNPNIIEDTYGKQTGYKTEAGKLATSVSKMTPYSKMFTTEINGVIKNGDITFKKTEEAISLKKMFLSWIKSRSGKELSEINRLENLITMLEADSTVRIMNKLKNGIPLNPSDIRALRLLKESLESCHKMKFGDKHLHAHIGYEDIRQLMFPENEY